MCPSIGLSEKKGMIESSLVKSKSSKEIYHSKKGKKKKTLDYIIKIIAGKLALSKMNSQASTWAILFLIGNCVLECISK